MRTLGFSTNAFKKNTLIEAIHAIGDAGYGAVELMADLHHAFPPTFDAGQRLESLALLADRGLRVSNINAFTHFAEGGDTYHPTWIEADRRLNEKRIEHTKQCIELASEFGAPTVSIQPGGVPLTTDLLRENMLELFAENLGKCLDHARLYGITLAVEPEPGLLIESAAEYMQFKTLFFADEQYVRMNCDVGHLVCVGDDPAAVIRQFPDEIAHVHLEDIGANRVHQHLAPGRGVMDFRAIFDALRDVKYRGSTTVELYPYETTAAGVAQMAIQHLAPIAAASAAAGGGGRP